MYFSVGSDELRIAGTMHLVPADFSNFPKWVDEAYDWSEEIITEHKLEEIFSYMSLQDGDHLRNHIPEKLWEDLVKHYVNTDRIEKISSLKPWAAMFFLSPIGKTSGGVEQYWNWRASKHPRLITYLESFKDVASNLDIVSNDVYAKEIHFMINNEKYIRDKFFELHAAWICGDLDGIKRSIAESNIWRSQALREAFITKRNHAWMPRIQSLISSGKRVLVGVGALHLCGDEGLIDLIKSDGKSVKLIIK